MAIASKEHIWEYANLEEFQLPYIFATLMDYPQNKSRKDTKTGEYKRKNWFRCWFDSSVARYDDLWIHRSTPLLFWRGWYVLQPGKRKPGIEDLVRCYSMELTDDFLDQERTIPDFVANNVERYINGSLLKE